MPRNTGSARPSMSHSIANATHGPVVLSIHIAPASRLPTKAVGEVVAESGRGLVGDRYHGTRHRHVSVQSATALQEASRILGKEIEPQRTRRNITISEGDVPSTPGTQIAIGPVELEVVRIAAPCRLLDDEIGPGAAAALRRRAGSIFRVLEGGVIGLGDTVRLDV
ncbi:MAG: MOSC domain-containing protein [Microthrixaceae bacterium]